MNLERKNGPSLLEKIEDFLELSGTQPTHLFIIISDDFSDDERNLFKQRNYSLLEVNSLERAYSPETTAVLLDAQAISRGIRSDTVLVINPDVHAAAMNSENQDPTRRNYAHLFRVGKQYSRMIDERNI